MRMIKALVLSVQAAALSVGGLSAVVALTGSVASTAAYAAKDKQISTKVGKPLKEAIDLANAGKYKDALAKAQEASAAPGKNAYDDYKVNEVTAFIATKAGDFATAAKAYEAMNSSSEAPPEQAKDRIAQLTKMYYQLNNFPKALQYGNQYMKDGGTDPLISLLVAQTYYQQKEYNKGIDAFQTLIKTANQAGQPVKEEWLQLLMNCQVNAGKEDDAVVTLEQLLTKNPKPEYWKSMLAYVGSHGATSDRKNLEIYRLKLRNGVLADSEYSEMAELSMALGFPGDAKTVLEKGFANKVLGVGARKDRDERLLKTAQQNSATDQKSLPAFDKEAKAAASGDNDVKLGFAYLSYGNNDQAIEAITRGLKKGNVKNPDEAHLLLGIAYVNAKRTSDAVSEFKAVPSDSKLAPVARLWIIEAKG